jgi:ATP-dependent Lon protease
MIEATTDGLIPAAPLAADAGARPDEPASAGGPQRERPSRALPEDALIIVPMRNVVLFPGVIMPITLGRERSRAAGMEAARLERPLGVLLQNDPAVDLPGPSDLHWVGTTANVVRYITAPDGAHHAICQGVQRFRVLQFLDGYPYTVARVEMIDQPETVDTEIEGRALNLRQRAGGNAVGAAKRDRRRAAGGFCGGFDGCQRG